MRKTITGTNPANGKRQGSIYTGGNPGNKGGGRPKSAVREACAQAFDERIKTLQEIADNPKSDTADRIRAIDLLGKYGGLQQTDITSGDNPLDLSHLTEEELLAIAFEHHEPGDEQAGAGGDRKKANPRKRKA